MPCLLEDFMTMVALVLAATTPPSLTEQVKGIVEFLVILATGITLVVGAAIVVWGTILKQFQGSKDDIAAKATAENAELIKALQGRTDLQEKELIELRARVTQLETTHAAEIAIKDAEINRQKGEIASMRAENDRLRARNGDLEIRVDRISELNATLSRRTRATDTASYQGPERRDDQEKEPAGESEVPRAI